MLGVKQMTDIPETKALIKGLPTLHLTGVTDEAVPAIKDTGFWVHYRSFGLDGWYIAVPNAVLPYFKAALAKQGVGFEVVKKLPRKYSWLLWVPAHFYMIFGWVLAVGDIAHMGKVWLAVTVGHIFCMATGIYEARPRYSAMLEPAVDEISSTDFLNNENCPATPGTVAWYTYGGGSK